MRPSIGRVARTPTAKIDRTLSANGPMARTVEDLALMLDAMCGEHPADPLSLPALPVPFLDAARAPARVKRVAWSADLGVTPVDPEIAAIARKAAERFAETGAIVEEAHPDLAGVHECFHVLRAYDYAVSKAELLRQHRELLKPEVIWNIEKGLKLTMDDLERVEAQRVTLTARALTFFDTYDLLLTPATIVPPFPIEQRYVGECNGTKFSNYLDWLAIAYAITMVCCPALSLPCGFTAERLAGRAADCRTAAQRSAHSLRRPAARGDSRPARHDADRPPDSFVGQPLRQTLMRRVAPTRGRVSR